MENLLNGLKALLCTGDPCTVTMIIADIRRIKLNKEEILSEIAPCYVKKYHDHKILRDKKQELVSGFLLKEYLGIVSDEQISYNEYGKPELVSGELHFNLSHSGNYVILAIAGCEVGADVEEIMSCHEATVKKVYREEQKRELEPLEGAARNEKFTEIWTKYEAVLKLNGTGFANGWDDISIGNNYIFTMKYEECYISCATMEEVRVEITRY